MGFKPEAPGFSHGENHRMLKMTQVDNVKQLPKPITLKFANLFNPGFQGAVNKVDNHTGFTAKSLFDWNKIKTKMDREAKQFDTVRLKLVKQHAALDDKGEAKIDDKTKQYVILDQPGLDRAFTELLDQTFEIRAARLPLAELLGVKLSAKELRELSDIIVEPVGIDED